MAKLIGTTRVILEPLSFALLAATHDMKVKEGITFRSFSTHSLDSPSLRQLV